MSQPDAPLTADDLDVGATATLYQGDPVVTRTDTDGDGRVDRVEVDLDADGDAEITERDTGGDGAIDDSHVDLAGRSDVVGFGDRDGDGHYETILRDTDGDGTADREDLDLDGDHVADRFGYGLDETDPFSGPVYAADAFPEPREGISEPLIDAPLGPDALDGFGSGTGSGADERAMDYEREALAEFGGSLAAPSSVDDALAAPGPGFGDGAVDTGPTDPGAGDTGREADYEQESVNEFAATVQDAPAEAVDDFYAAPVLAPVAEVSDVDAALAAPDDDYVG